MEHKIIHREINSLIFAEYNPRQLTKDQYQNLKDSISRFGLVDPIILNKDFTVIGGHQRLKVCKQLKYKDIDCVVLDLTKEDERELNIRLNQSGGEFDLDILANEFDIEELKDWGFKEIELGLNIDKIDIEEEPEQDNYIITIIEDDLKKANEIFKELDARGLNVKIKL